MRPISPCRIGNKAALAVVRDDDAVDREYEGLVRQCITHMMEEPKQAGVVMDILWSLRSLERIGDHTCNVAEYVIYLVKGEDVRHVGLQEMAREVGASRTAQKRRNRREAGFVVCKNGDEEKILQMLFR